MFALQKLPLLSLSRFAISSCSSFIWCTIGNRFLHIDLVNRLMSDSSSLAAAPSALNLEPRGFCVRLSNVFLWHFFGRFDCKVLLTFMAQLLLLLLLCFCWICWLICVLIGHLSDGRGVWRNEFLVDAQQLFARRDSGNGSRGSSRLSAS